MSSILLPVIASSRRRSGILLAEDFTGTGLPAGWTFNGTGTCNPDFYGGSPQGGQCIEVISNTASSAGGAQKTLSGVPATYGAYFQILFQNAGNKNAQAFVFGDHCWFGLYATQSWMGVAGTGFSSWTWYHVWIDGTPTTQLFYRSTTGTKPGSPTISRTGIGPTAPTKVAIGTSSNDGFRLDKLRLATYHLGSNPA